MKQNTKNNFKPYHACVLSCFSYVRLFATLWAVAHQPPLSMGFPRQEDWSWLPVPPPGDLPDPGIKPASVTLPALAGGFFTICATWEAQTIPYSCDEHCYFVYCFVAHMCMQVWGFACKLSHNTARISPLDRSVWEPHSVGLLNGCPDSSFSLLICPRTPPPQSNESLQLCFDYVTLICSFSTSFNRCSANIHSLPDPGLPETNHTCSILLPRTETVPRASGSFPVQGSAPAPHYPSNQE